MCGSGVCLLGPQFSVKLYKALFWRVISAQDLVSCVVTLMQFPVEFLINLTQALIGIVVVLVGLLLTKCFGVTGGLKTSLKDLRKATTGRCQGIRDKLRKSVCLFGLSDFNGKDECGVGAPPAKNMESEEPMVLVVVPLA